MMYIGLWYKDPNNANVTLNCNTSYTRWSVSSVVKHLEAIYQTREGVFHLISKHVEVI